MSSDRAARPSEKARARGSSATRGGGAGTLASVRGSPALAGAGQVEATGETAEERGPHGTAPPGVQEKIRPVTPGIDGGAVHPSGAALGPMPSSAYHQPGRAARSSGFPPRRGRGRAAGAGGAAGGPLPTVVADLSAIRRGGSRS